MMCYCASRLNSPFQVYTSVYICIKEIFIINLFFSNNLFASDLLWGDALFSKYISFIWSCIPIFRECVKITVSILVMLLKS